MKNLKTPVQFRKKYLNQFQNISLGSDVERILTNVKYNKKSASLKKDSFKDEGKKIYMLDVYDDGYSYINAWERNEDYTLLRKIMKEFLKQKSPKSV